MDTGILEAWRTNQRINRLLIDAINADAMSCTLSSRGGRSVVRQFCHLHNVRLHHLDARARDLAEGLKRFETRDEPPKKTLLKHLDQSAERIERFLSDCAAGVAKRRGFKKGPAAFLAYLIAHESHHRGNIVLTLKQSGHPVDKTVRQKIWDWDRI